MPVVPLKDVLDDAFARRYGVPAINIVNDLTIEAVLAAAVEERSPVIVQTSVKTVRPFGRDQLFGDVHGAGRRRRRAVDLHLDHCPERAVITECLAGGWNSVLFDAHELRVAENLRQTIEVVAEARPSRRPRRGRDRGDPGRRGRRRLRRGVGAADPRGRRRLHRAHRRRLLRAGHRQRARPVQGGAGARPPAGHRPGRGDRHPDGAARRHRPVGRPVPGPDRARMRQGQHLHRAQGDAT